jgi:probable F420-dependent oxidoreductase
VRLGVLVPMAPSDGGGRMPSWPEVLGFARHAEAVGLDSLWVYDHFFSAGPGEPPEGQLEAWTVVSALAAATERVELGQLVMCASFRPPGLLAKMAATADVISGGRVTLGLGAGWYDPEYDAFGYPRDHRVDRFEEALQVITGLLRGERVTFEGRYQQVRDAELMPSPERPVPILIAGRRPRMLTLIARHADAWNTAWFGRPDDRLRERLAELDAAMEREGRDPATLRRTIGALIRHPDAARDEEDGHFEGSAAELTGVFDEFAELGIDDLTIVLDPMTEPSLDHLAEAIEVWRA